MTAKKALVTKSTNTKSLPSTKKRSNFDLVASGVCPHDNAKLRELEKTSGVGVYRTCVECKHRWYLNKKIRTCKCLPCSESKRKVGKNEANNKSNGGKRNEN